MLIELKIIYDNEKISEELLNRIARLTAAVRDPKTPGLDTFKWDVFYRDTPDLWHDYM